MLPRVDEVFALAQVERFAALDGYPKKEAAVGELVKALMTASNQRSAEQFIDRWMRDETKCPKPKHVLDAFRAYQNPYQEAPTTDCRICGGTGWKIVTAAKSTPEGRPYTAAKRCICRPVGVAR